MNIKLIIRYRDVVEHVLKCIFGLLIVGVMLLVPVQMEAQAQTVTGQVTSSDDGTALPGVNVVVKGTNTGTSTNTEGKYELTVPSLNDTLIFSFVGYQAREVSVNGRTEVNIGMQPQAVVGEEMVVVGYGMQEKSDITGSVASVSQDRLEAVPNINIAQALQGSIPGANIRTTSAGASPSQSLMIRGRNSIEASNSPLIVLDGVPYEGALRDISVHDVESIEVLKDASAAAIYGSRGSNGVILVTTKSGGQGSPTFSYDGKYSIQSYVNIPDLMNGEEFYNFKTEREPGSVTQSEQEIYEVGEWVDWYDLALRRGISHDHNFSVSGGFDNTTYYIGGNLLDVRGLTVNDEYQRMTGRINLDTQVADWLSIGTRTQFSYDDRSGSSPSWSDLYYMNPLSKPYNEEGDLSIYPWEEDTYFNNPLSSTLYDNVRESQQLVTNNFLIIDFPFLPGLSNRLNTGVRKRAYNSSEYRGRNTAEGLEDGGSADQTNIRYDDTVIENILSYDNQFAAHDISVTGVFSYEKKLRREEELNAEGFPHDFLSWYAAEQAESVVPDYSYSQTKLISFMMRMNYAYNNRYLLTITARRDGYSGFGTNTKWGNFPSVALGWNLANESFFPWKNTFNELKPRISLGLNGNQAVGAYETITRLGSEDYVSINGNTLPGYMPSVLGMDELGWEASTTINLGLDFSIFKDRIAGDLNLYKTNTSDLLLDRSISPIHGITSITQNIGETENRGLEFSISSNNVVNQDFTWSSSVNFSYNKNKILSLYGELDEEGNEIDDVGNEWFIGEPINVNYGYVWDGVWQLDEADEAEEWGSQPGFVKIKDLNKDGVINENDRQIIGQTDPQFLWGMTQTFSYQNLTLEVFLHGVHGHKRFNSLMTDDEVWPEVRRNTTKKNWWTPENSTNDWYMNHPDARLMDGHSVNIYENASFVRIKDISLSYDFGQNLLQSFGIDRLRLYMTGRNLFTFTNYTGLDPELGSQQAAPLQKEYVFGLDIGF